MKFTELQKLLENNFDTSKLSDIAYELDVTPQVVNNWRIRNQVPYKYVKKVREKIKDNQASISNSLNPHDIQFQNIDYNPKHNQDVKIIVETCIKFLSRIFEKRKFIYTSLVIAFLLCIFHIQIFNSPVFISRARILPASNSNSSSLNSLASQFGVNVGQNEASSLSDSKLFPEIILSRRLASTIINDRFDTKKFGDKVPLVNILNGLSNKDSVTSLHKKIAIERFLGMINVEGSKSALITISATSFESNLSNDLVNSVIENLTKLLKYFRISELKEKKQFIINRINEVEKTLVSSEDELKNFREKNRSINFSPSLLLQEERYQRVIEVQKEIYITLKSELEMTQVDEYSESTFVQLLDEAESTGDVSLSALSLVILYFVLGLSLGMVAVFMKDWIDENKEIFNFKK
jgi:uncharacterized protein involved in exopolysaccharide biosynthesis